MMIVSLEVKSIVIGTILVLAIVQQLHLVSLADSIDEAAEAETAEPAASAARSVAADHAYDGDEHSETDVNDTEVDGDDSSGNAARETKSALRSLGLESFVDPTSVLEEASSVESEALKATEPTGGHKETEVIDDTDGSLSQVTVSENEDGTRTTTKVFVSKHSKETKNAADRPRVITGLGFGLGKGLIG